MGETTVLFVYVLSLTNAGFVGAVAFPFTPFKIAGFVISRHA